MKLIGASHLHTTYSYDGKLKLRELKERLLEERIQFALITEHSDFIEPHEAEKFIKECHNLSDGDITLIPGFEVPYRDAHILMIGVHHFVKTGPCNAEDLERWKAQATLSVWAHPHRNKYLLYDAIKNVIDGIEVWNSQYDGKKAPRMKVLESLQELRARGGDVHAYAGYDLHREEHFGGPVIELEAQNKSEDILLALKEGKFVIKGRSISIRADGKITRGNMHIIRLRSLYWVAVITTLKNLSKYAAKFHIPIPKRLRESIRKRI